MSRKVRFYEEDGGHLFTVRGEEAPLVGDEVEHPGQRREYKVLRRRMVVGTDQGPAVTWLVFLERVTAPEQVDQAAFTSEQAAAVERAMDIVSRGEGHYIGLEDARALLQLAGLYSDEAFIKGGYPRGVG